MKPIVEGLPPYLGKLLKDVIYKWSKTQSLDLTNQLQLGIRYLDLRIACKPESNDIHIVHGLFGKQLYEILDELILFLDTHPKEIILVDFYENYLSSNQQTEFLNMIVEKLGDKCCPRLDVESLTLETMWENEFQVIVFHKENMIQDDSRFWSRDVIPRPWPRVSNADQMIAFLDTSYHQRCPDKFHGTQGIISPDANFMFSHMESDLQEQTRLHVAKPFVSWLKKKFAGEKGINICVMDFIQFRKYIPSVLSLNTKYVH